MFLVSSTAKDTAFCLSLFLYSFLSFFLSFFLSLPNSNSANYSTFWTKRGNFRSAWIEFWEDWSTNGSIETNNNLNQRCVDTSLRKRQLRQFRNHEPFMKLLSSLPVFFIRYSQSLMLHHLFLMLIVFARSVRMSIHPFIDWIDAFGPVPFVCPIGHSLTQLTLSFAHVFIRSLLRSLHWLLP